MSTLSCEDEYDALNRVDKVTHGTGLATTYTYDAVGNLERGLIRGRSAV